MSNPNSRSYTKEQNFARENLLVAMALSLPEQ